MPVLQPQPVATTAERARPHPVGCSRPRVLDVGAARWRATAARYGCHARRAVPEAQPSPRREHSRQPTRTPAMRVLGPARLYGSTIWTRWLAGPTGAVSSPPACAPRQLGDRSPCPTPPRRVSLLDALATSMLRAWTGRAVNWHFVVTSRLIDHVRSLPTTGGDACDQSACGDRGIARVGEPFRHWHASRHR